MGYRADYSIESREIFARTDHSEIYFVPDVGYFDDKEGYVELEKPGILIDEKFYLPIRFAAWYTKHSVAYDRKTNTARMVEYGYGQEQVILDLVKTYDRAFTVKLLASDHIQRSYLTDSKIAPQVSEIPDRIYNVDITSITYESANQALLYVTYIRNNQVMDDQHEIVFRIIKENNQWKILQDRYLSSNTTLPEDIDKSVHTIKENFNEKQQNVLSDLRQYYRAFNQKDFDLTYKYTSPFDIERMNANAVDEWRTWEHITRASFEYGDTTYHMSNERVVFLGEKQAVVHATLEWSYISENIEQNHSIYEALIYLDYANGHWNYSYDHDISVNEEDPNRMLPEIHFPEPD